MRTTPTVLAACVLAMAGCEKSPVAPGPLPFVVTPTHLTITGPPSVAPGGTAQFRVLMTSVSGSRDVSQDATWESTNAEVLQSRGAGVFAASATGGETSLVATYGSADVMFHVLVLESGTFVLRGTVSDAGVAVAGAHVQITSGIGAGRDAMTDASGRYALYGAAGAVTLSVTERDYQPLAQTVDVSGDTVANFGLIVRGDRPDINGSWRLTFTASPACIDVPEDGRNRVYAVSISQIGPAAQMTLTLASSAWTLTDTVPITAHVLGQTLTFTFPNDDFDGPSVYEHLSGGYDMTLEGTASAAYASGRFDGLVNGIVRVFTPTTRPGTMCSAADHHWRLERVPKSGVARIRP
jgi:carboxypeptidase family protein